MKKLLLLFVFVALSASVFANTKESKLNLVSESFTTNTVAVRKTPISVSHQLSCGLSASYEYTPANGMTSSQVLAEITAIHNYLEMTYCGGTVPTIE